MIFLSGTDDEYVANRLVVRGGPIACFTADFGREHPVQLGDGEVVVGDDRVVGSVALGLLDVLRPPLVVTRRVDGNADDLHVAAVELRFDLRHIAELGRAHRCEVLRMREEHRPGVADPVVEPNLALRRLRRKVRRRVVDRQSHFPPFLWSRSPALPGARTYAAPESPCSMRPSNARRCSIVPRVVGFAHPVRRGIHLVLGIVRERARVDASTMLWPVAALVVFAFGFVVVYGSVLQSRLDGKSRVDGH